VWHSTTILSVRRGSTVAIGGDGQVTYGTQIMKSDTRKIRRLHDDNVLVGFAGSTADAFTLIERFEKRLKDFPENLLRAATELARDWRNDRNLKKLEAMLIAVDARHSLLVTGQGDVLQTPDDVLGIGTGGPYAIASARALLRHSTLSATEIVRESMLIASGIDVYTNENVTVEELPCAS
jgi:ATP-dependent HslUV protease subunit HslV